VSESASISTGIAGRYATAVFELAKDGNALSALEGDIAALGAAMSESADFRSLINSPVYSREAQGAAIGAIAAKMGLSDVMGNTLKLMASKRRLFVLPQLLAGLRELIDDEKRVLPLAPPLRKQLDGNARLLDPGQQIAHTWSLAEGFR